MINIYWPVLKNIEREVLKLTYSLHIDDKQEGVYSSKIVDLILRSAAEIESLSKELYIREGGTKTGEIKYDSDAIKFLNQKWNLKDKLVILSSSEIFLSKRIYKPFVKDEKRTGKETMTYGWNNSYQNLKHNRGNSLEFGSIKYLLEILSSLYVLNIYYKDEVFELKKDSTGTSFPINLGSDLFSIKLGTSHGDGDGNTILNNGSEECIYYIKWTDKSAQEFKEATTMFNSKMMDLAMKNPKFMEFINKTGANYKGNNFLFDALGQQDYLTISGIAARETSFDKVLSENEAVLNKRA